VAHNLPGNTHLLRRALPDAIPELAPDLNYPIARRTIREMLNETSGQIVKKLGNQNRDER
jgi:hypothetical protein